MHGSFNMDAKIEVESLHLTTLWLLVCWSSLQSEDKRKCVTVQILTDCSVSVWHFTTWHFTQQILHLSLATPFIISPAGALDNIFHEGKKWIYENTGWDFGDTSVDNNTLKKVKFQIKSCHCVRHVWQIYNRTCRRDQPCGARKHQLRVRPKQIRKYQNHLVTGSVNREWMQ